MSRPDAKPGAATTAPGTASFVGTRALAELPSPPFVVPGCTGFVIHTSDSGTTPTYIVVAGAVPARGQMPQGIDVVWCLPFGFEIDMLIRPMRRRLARAAYASFGSMADDGVATEAHRLVPGV